MDNTSFDYQVLKELIGSTLETNRCPCNGCGHGWGNVSNDGCETCHDSCHVYQLYLENEAQK